MLAIGEDVIGLPEEDRTELGLAGKLWQGLVKLRCVVVVALEPGRKLSFPFTIEITLLPPDEYSLELRVLVDEVESDRTSIRFVR